MKDYVYFYTIKMEDEKQILLHCPRFKLQVHRKQLYKLINESKLW